MLAGLCILAFSVGCGTRNSSHTLFAMHCIADVYTSALRRVRIVLASACLWLSMLNLASVFSVQCNLMVAFSRDPSLVPALLGVRIVLAPSLGIHCYRVRRHSEKRNPLLRHSWRQQKKSSGNFPGIMFHILQPSALCLFVAPDYPDPQLKAQMGSNLHLANVARNVALY